MALTVNDSFYELNKDTVNLDSEETKTARSSRDWLITQLTSLPDKIDDFPRLYEGKSLKFGSFARNTKIRPLDDIDLMLAFSAEGSTYSTITYGKKYSLFAPETATNLRKLCNDDGSINSIKVVNKIVSSLNQIEQYKKSDKHRRQEAATLNLTSYDWTFDIVPCFYTDTGYYLIPDGNGLWKASDPRIDQERVNNLNAKHDKYLLQLIRTAKYWKQVTYMPDIPSYLFECFILNFAESESELQSFVDLNLIRFLNYLKNKIYYSVPDPKGFQGELNFLSFEDQKKISEKVDACHKIALEAHNLEITDKNMKGAINKWRQLFGAEFPEYG
jgi:hypothetical protein